MIQYSSGGSERARLTVHDVAGRELARIFEGRLPPGSGHWIWSASDPGGEVRLAAGVYLVRFATVDGVQTRKIVLLE